jgi:uncharacterized membrane protein YkoI
MKNKKVIFGLVGLLTIGTTIGILARDESILTTYRGLNAEITKEEAKQIALGLVEDGTVVDIELDTEDGRLVYEVEVTSNGMLYEKEIDANTGDVYTDVNSGATMSSDQDYSDDYNNVTSADVNLSEQEALDVAKKSLGGISTVVNVELDDEDGVLVYEIELNQDNKEFDFVINANTGAIISQEQDYSDDYDNVTAADVDLSEQEAIDIAKKSLGGISTVVKVELDD